ncbi:MAG: c-type cytochrome [Rhodanobacter sp.]
MRIERGTWTVLIGTTLLCWVFPPVAASAPANAQAPNTRISAAEAWAFPQFPPPDPHAPKADPARLIHVAGSTRTYTQAQLDADHFVPDWFPQDHPAAPPIVTVARHPGWPWPCAECHMSNGAGVPATAQIMGLPKAYIREQIAAFRQGQRGASPSRTTRDMADEARSIDDDDLEAAASYFSRLKFVPHTRVIESASVPKTHWEYFVLRPDQGGAREPTGERIVEVPVSFDDYRHGSDRTRYVAYVPPGSIARGAVIAARGSGGLPACESCHGAKLQGTELIPPLAGRSPTCIVRELLLFRGNQRSNPAAAPMRLQASRLTVGDMIAVAAYAGSRTP